MAMSLFINNITGRTITSGLALYPDSLICPPYPRRNYYSLTGGAVEFCSKMAERGAGGKILSLTVKRAKRVQEKVSVMAQQDNEHLY